MKNFRDWLGIVVIVISILALGFVGYKIVNEGNSAEYQLVYSSLLPLVGTWVGVVLAFYFGKENYEAASKRYETIIDKLSPEILDDIQVNQIMISKKTMVSKKWDDIKDKPVKDVIAFLVDIDKTRLPVLDSSDKVKYIIHSSLLSKPIKDNQNQVQAANTSVTMSEFVGNHLGVVDQIVIVKETDILEDVRKKMSSKPDCKDVFIEDGKGNLSGWLTDTLILRYIHSNNA